jgi:hypothetical protein
MRGYGRHFPKASYVERRLSNLDAYAIDARTAINHAIALGRRGITIYADPKPRAEMFLPVVTRVTEDSLAQRNSRAVGYKHSARRPDGDQTGDHNTDVT